MLEILKIIHNLPVNFIEKLLQLFLDNKRVKIQPKSNIMAKITKNSHW